MLYADGVSLCFSCHLEHVCLECLLHSHTIDNGGTHRLLFPIISPQHLLCCHPYVDPGQSMVKPLTMYQIPWSILTEAEVCSYYSLHPQGAAQEAATEKLVDFYPLQRRLVRVHLYSLNFLTLGTGGSFHLLLFLRHTNKHQFTQTW